MKKAFILMLAAVLLCAASCRDRSDSAVTDGAQETEHKTERITETTRGNNMTETIFNPDDGENTLYHIILLGQSLSMGYSSTGTMEPCKSKQAFMFRQVRTQDFGYCFGISREEYDADTDKYDGLFYAALNPLAETGGDGNRDMRWEDASWNEYETPASGIVSGLYNAYRRAGYDDIPYRVLVSAPGIGGTPMSDFGAGGKIYRRTEKDLENGKRLAAENGLDYRVLAFIWIQGEAESYLSVPAVDYEKGLVSTRKQYSDLAKKVTGQEETPEFVTYQTATVAVYNPTAMQIAPLGQFAAASDGKNGIAISAPCYQFETAGDSVHLTGISSRNLGILLGQTLYEKTHGQYRIFAPDNVTVSGRRAKITFPFRIAIDSDAPPVSCDFYTAARQSGFICYGKGGEEIECSVSLSEDGYTLTLECSGDISEITYGYDPHAEKNRQFTIGGNICLADTITGYDGVLSLFMPIQDIFRK